ISLRKLVENPLERDPSGLNTEARKFLVFLKGNDGYSDRPIAWKNIFNEFNEKAAQDFVQELIVGGWVKRDYINQLDMGMFITEKAYEILTSHE
ncbi:MAG: hypothetical protein HQK53_19810, partial [Oligoflexia bacterium]|nr:hypothetical protein [Oligoflexia bacterium]